MVEILKKEQEASEKAIEQLAGGGRIRFKRGKVVQHEDTIIRLKTKLKHLKQNLPTELDHQMLL